MIVFFIAGLACCVCLAVDGGIKAFSNKRTSMRGRKL